MHYPESLKLVADTLWRVEQKDMEGVVEDIFTPSEIVELWERLNLLKWLKEGKTQRQIAEDLGISVTTVSRGSRVLKYGRGVIAKYL